MKKISKYSNTIIGGLLLIALILAIVISNNKFAQNKYVGFNSIGINEYFTLLNSKDTNIIYIGKTGCGFCQKAEPVFLDLIRQYNVVINKIDIANLNQADYTKLSNSIESDEHLPAEKWGTPLLVITRDGEFVEHVIGYVEDENKYINLFKKYNIIK
jgi:thiol-disulfide isomerase/thioredoxin